MLSHSTRSYSRVESASYGKKGVYQTVLLFLLTVLMLILVGLFGPDVFLLHVSGAMGISRTTNVIGYSFQQSHMDSFNQAIWAELSLERSSNSISSVATHIDLYVDLVGFEGFYDDMERRIIDKRPISRELTFANNSRRSEPMHLFLLNGIEFRQYNVSVFLNSSSWSPQIGEDNIITYVSFKCINAKYTVFELALKYILCFVTLCILFLPYHGYYIRLLAVPIRQQTFEQKWVVSLLIALVFFNDPLIGLQVCICTGFINIKKYRLPCYWFL
jgi:Wnt-binding factor required for Wnt secretion